jgi:hypothetical protein
VNLSIALLREKIKHLNMTRILVRSASMQVFGKPVAGSSAVGKKLKLPDKLPLITTWPD